MMLAAPAFAEGEDSPSSRSSIFGDLNTESLFNTAYPSSEEPQQEEVKQELQIMCVLYTADVGGILMVVYDENGNLELKVDHKEDDFTFDEIGSVLKIKELQKTKEELFESLEMFYKVFYLGEDSDDI